MNKLLQVSRDSSLKIPKKIEDCNEVLNSVDDKVAVKQAIATANNDKFDKKQLKENIENDKELDIVNNYR